MSERGTSENKGAERERGVASAHLGSKLTTRLDAHAGAARVPPRAQAAGEASQGAGRRGPAQQRSSAVLQRAQRSGTSSADRCERAQDPRRARHRGCAVGRAVLLHKNVTVCSACVLCDFKKSVCRSVACPQSQLLPTKKSNATVTQSDSACEIREGNNPSAL